jgi:hypothetical protein
VGGRGVEVVVTLFYIFTMISLGTGQSKKALLEERITSIP